MDFSEFLNKVDVLKESDLGGIEAQFQLAPKLRLKYDENKIKAQNPRRAAVLALCYPNANNETILLLTERASYKGTHSAQISFPGGKVEKADTSLQETALREAYEEVGIVPNSVTVVKEMTDVYIPPSNFLATPFLAYVDYEPEFVTNHEVAQLVKIQLDDILDEGKLVEVNMNTSYMTNVKVPAFEIEEKIIWGATGMMLSEIKQLIEKVYLD